MPNHVTHKMIVTGEQSRLDEFKEYVSGEEDCDCISFDKIIPMPKILRDTVSGGGVSEGEIALLIMEGNLEAWSEWVHRYESVTSPDEYVAYIKQHRPNSIEQAMLCRQAKEETGYSDWYSWSIENWGTKWDAYDTSLSEEYGRLEYVFDTAWSVPEPIFNKLFDKFPDLNFEIGFFDEGHFFWGYVFIINGVASSRINDENDKANLCIELKGYDPNENYDEDEDEENGDELGLGDSSGLEN